MANYMINGQPDMDPRPRVLRATCPHCLVCVDWRTPRTMDDAVLRAWEERHRAAGRSVVGMMHRSLWQEGECTCEEQTHAAE